MKVKCPNCKEEVEIEDTALKYHKHGRQTDCPKCKKGIIFKRFVQQSK